MQAAVKRLAFVWWLVAWDHYTVGAVSLKQLSFQFALRYKASVIEVASLAAAEGLPESLPVVYDPKRNGLEESVHFPIAVDTVIAGRYQICDYLGSGVFSRAVQCVELQTGRMVCIKIIRNNKDFLDQSLGEIKLLRYLNENDPHDTRHVLRMEDFFYYREHLFIVTELLRDNLYELYKIQTCWKELSTKELPKASLI